MPGDSPVVRMTCGAVVGIALILAPLLFFGLGSFLNWLIP